MAPEHAFHGVVAVEKGKQRIRISHHLVIQPGTANRHRLMMQTDKNMP